MFRSVNLKKKHYTKSPQIFRQWESREISRVKGQLASAISRTRKNFAPVCPFRVKDHVEDWISSQLWFLSRNSYSLLIDATSLSFSRMELIVSFHFNGYKSANCYQSGRNIHVCIIYNIYSYNFVFQCCLFIFFLANHNSIHLLR